MQPGDGGWARWGSAVDWMSHVVNSFESTWYLKKIQLFSDHFPSFVASSFGFGASFEVSAGMVSRHTPGSIHLRRARRSLPPMRWPSRPRKSHAAKCNSSFGFLGGKNATLRTQNITYLIIKYNNMIKKMHNR